MFLIIIKFLCLHYKKKPDKKNPKEKIQFIKTYEHVNKYPTFKD